MEPNKMGTGVKRGSGGGGREGDKGAWFREWSRWRGVAPGGTEEDGRPQSQAQQWSVRPQADLQLSAENENRELMSLEGAKNAFLLIPAPWEQPERQRGPGPGWAAGLPHSGAWPAGQPPAGTSRQAAIALPACSPTLCPAASSLGQATEGSSCGLVSEANVTAVCSPGQ
jgi:hypothetical protein